MANEDFLTAVVDTVVGYLRGDAYFSPPGGKAIPVLAEVREDARVLQEMKDARGSGPVVLVGYDAVELSGDGCLMAGGTLIVRVEGLLGLERGEGLLRIAQKAGLVLFNKPAALNAEGQRIGGGLLRPMRIVSALYGEGDVPQGRAWHLMVSWQEGAVIDFGRLADPEDGTGL